jgi:hypothetical protein
MEDKQRATSRVQALVRAVKQARQSPPTPATPPPPAPKPQPTPQ